jgi:hypothetical protein
MNLLFVNQSGSEIQRLLARLSLDGVRPDWQQAGDEARLRACLAAHTPDAVCDYAHPTPTGLMQWRWCMRCARTRR